MGPYGLFGMGAFNIWMVLGIVLVVSVVWFAIGAWLITKDMRHWDKLTEEQKEKK